MMILLTTLLMGAILVITATIMIIEDIKFKKRIKEERERMNDTHYWEDLESYMITKNPEPWFMEGGEDNDK